MKKLLALIALAACANVHAVDAAAGFILIPLADSIFEGVSGLKYNKKAKAELEEQITELREHLASMPPPPVYRLQSTDRFQQCVREVKDDLSLGVRPLCYCAKRERIDTPEIQRSCPVEAPSASADGGTGRTTRPAKDAIDQWMRRNCQPMAARDEGTIYTSSGDAIRILRGDQYLRCAK